MLDCGCRYPKVTKVGDEAEKRMTDQRCSVPRREGDRDRGRESGLIERDFETEQEGKVTADGFIEDEGSITFPAPSPQDRDAAIHTPMLRVHTSLRWLASQSGIWTFAPSRRIETPLPPTAW
jgi:hypothetical protein